MRATLMAALASMDRNNAISTVNQLRAFQNQVWAQISPSHPTLAEGLTSSAQNTINALVRQR